MPVPRQPAGSDPIDASPRRRGASRLAGLPAASVSSVAADGRCSLATAAILAFVLAGRRHEFAAALSDAGLWVLASAALLQSVALLARSEAWHLSI